MAITLVKSAEGISALATVAPAFGSATTTGNLVVLAFASDDYNGTPGAGWTQSTGMEQQTFHGGYIWWRISAGETSYSYTIGSATNSAWILAEFAGAHATPYDISNGTFTTGGGTSLTTPSITPTSGNRLLVAMGGSSLSSGSLAAATGSFSDSFTLIRDVGNSAGGTRDWVSLGWRLVTANGSTGYSVACGVSISTESRSALIIAFKEAGAVAGKPAKVWSGSAWVTKPVKVWSGSAWVTKPTKVWNGSAWV